MDTPPRNSQIVRVPSRSQPGEIYEVDLAKPSCTCLGFAFRQTCKHLTLARRLRETTPGDGPPKP